MDIYKIILNRRTIRRFKNKKIDYVLLEKFVNAGRFAPSGGNLQSWEFVTIDAQDILGKVFDTLKWANYLKDGPPPEDKRPTAYIVILTNRRIRAERGEYEIGMAAENIMLSALEEGIGTCCIGSINKEKLKNILNVPDYSEIELVIALGYPDEKSLIEEMKDDSVKYWRDEKGNMHVPKRDIGKILHRNFYKKAF